jgi:hypothetical protein
MGEFFGVFRAAMGLGLLFLVIAIPVLIVEAGIHYWPIVLLLVAGVVGLVVYRKRQKRLRDLV